MSGGNGAYCRQAFPTLPRGSPKLDYGNSDQAGTTRKRDACCGWLRKALTVTAFLPIAQEKTHSYAKLKPAGFLRETYKEHDHRCDPDGRRYPGRGC
jgi:hypothetical protein